jgi:hypothetical protein
MPERDIPSKIVLGTIAFGLCFIVGAILKTIGTVLLISYLVFCLGLDWIAAWSNERHVEENPHLLKNEAIGETVTVNGDFEAQAGAAKGFVFLHGHMVYRLFRRHS